PRRKRSVDRLHQFRAARVALGARLEPQVVHHVAEAQPGAGARERHPAARASSNTRRSRAPGWQQASEPPAPAWPNALGGFVAPNDAPSMKPRPKQLSIISTASFPHACSTVAAATVASCNVRMPSTSPMHDAYIRASERASPIPFDDGSSHLWSARVFHISL